MSLPLRFIFIGEALNPLTWWRWARALPQNPIYLREKGTWGKPNPFFDNLIRFSPFIIIGSISLGFCAGFGNPVIFANNEDLFTLWCLICLPGILLFMLTFFGVLMAPALTAPMISLERDRGTWEILRATPQPMASILMAKFFGALSRLRIWPLLFVLTLLQGMVIFCSTVIISEGSPWSWSMGAATIFRPWLEILFAAFTGLLFSTAVRSATMALVSSYAVVVIFKLFNNSLVWVGLMSNRLEGEIARLGMSTVGPTAVYALAIIAVWGGIFYQASKLE